MPSPGIPKIVSTPQSISVSTSTSPPVMAISFLHLMLLLFENAPDALRSLRLLFAERNFIRRSLEDDAFRHFRGVGDPSQRHCDAQLLAEDLERLGDARLAVGAKAVEVSAADEAGACAETEELQHVEARANAAVDIDLRSVAHRFDDRWQGRCRRWRAVELPPPVVGDEDRIGAG